MSVMQTNEPMSKHTSLSRFAFALPPLLLTVCILAATWKLAFADRIIARGDLLLYFYPLRDYAAQALREGRLPLWNPYTFMGAPFLANSQAGFFYPFNALMAWLPAEKAVSYSIVLHLIIAALGMYALARAGLKLGILAAFTSAITFGLGGYLGAQVEHLNQLQVLSWLPLQVLILYRSGQSSRFALKPILLLSLLIALQVLAGHTQSLYICLVALAVVALTRVLPALSHLHTFTLSHLHPLLLLAVAGVLAALMCAAQLLPTLELSRESYRSGGMTLGEVASFSWRPWVIGRALMPGYGDSLFPEYVAYIGAFGLALAVLGVVSGGGRGGSEAETTDGGRRTTDSVVVRRPPSVVSALALVVVGFVLALGIVIAPLFNVLFYWLPGFNLFRAQARWLVVFVLGVSILVGLGVQALSSGLTTSTRRLWLLGWVVLMGLLAGVVVIGVRISPEPEYASLPERRVLMGWVIAAGVSTLLVLLAQVKLPRINLHPFSAILFTLALVGELLAAAQYQPYARASDREALTDLRPATAHLLAGQRLGETGRVLALSGLFFDPGDLPEQTLIYQTQLDKDELYDRVIASKQKEVLSPNLSLYYQLPSVDGYDGGLLPTRRFVNFASQFTPTPRTGTLDGRLREFLKAVPSNRWLEQMAVRYVIADKTQDIFVDGIYYDMLFSAAVSPTLALTLAPYESTALGLVISATQIQPNQVLATGQVQFADGTAQPVELRAPGSADLLAGPYFGVRIQWEGRRIATALTLAVQANVSSLTLRGLTSIDDADHSFLAQMIQTTGPDGHTMRVVHSGDVKIYENLDVAPRALLRDATGPMTYTVELIEDAPERVALRVQTAIPAQLVLRDACYPGWVARIDGSETSITCTDILFRQIEVPASPNLQTIVFSYEPQSVRLGLIISAVGLLFWLVLGILSFVHRRPKA